LIASDVQASRLNACRELLRLYSTDVLSGYVDGPIEGDRAHLEGVRFGVDGATDLLLWDTGLKSVNLCDHARSVRVGGPLGTVKCSACDGLPDAPEAVCIEPGEPPAVARYTCPSFEEPAVCSEPSVRERPFNDGLAYTE
jgi:hypothetical protein